MENQTTPYFNSKEAAAYCKCSYSKLVKAVLNFEMQYYKNGRQWLFTKEQLDAWVQKNMIQPRAVIRENAINSIKR